jgi:O-antigen/teichoic acid export membrane protein
MKSIFLFTGMAKVLGAIGLLSFNILVARTLSLKEAGMFFFAITIASLYTIVIKFGMDVYMQKEAGRAYQSNKIDLFKNLHFKSTCLSVLVFFTSSLLIIFFYITSSKTLSFEVILIGLTSFFISICWINSGFLKAKAEPVFANLLDYGGILVLASLFILCMPKQIIINFKDLIIIYFLSSLLCSIAGSYLVHRNTKKKPLQLEPHSQYGTHTDFLKTHLKSMLNVLSSQLFYYGMLWSSLYILEYFHNDEEVAKYNVIFRTALAVSFLLGISNSVFVPKINKYISNGDTSKLRSLHLFISKQLALTTLPLLLILIVFSNQILGLYGNEYQNLTTALIIISSAQYINTITGPINLILILKDRSKIVRNQYFLSMIIAIILSLILVPPFKSLGALISVSFALVFQNTVLTYYAYKKIY